MFYKQVKLYRLVMAWLDGGRDCDKMFTIEEIGQQIRKFWASEDEGSLMRLHLPATKRNWLYRLMLVKVLLESRTNMARTNCRQSRSAPIGMMYFLEYLLLSIYKNPKFKQNISTCGTDKKNANKSVVSRKLPYPGNHSDPHCIQRVAQKTG